VRTIADLVALTAGLAADLVRRDGPLRRAPHALLALLREWMARALVLLAALRDGERRTAAFGTVVRIARRSGRHVVVLLAGLRDGERRAAAFQVVVRAAARSGRRALVLLARLRDSERTAAVIGSALRGAERFGHRALEVSRPHAGALADASTRAVAALARSVLALPGGPVPVMVSSAVVLLVAVYAWIQPADSDRVQMRPFVVEYAFDYSAELPPNVVYEDRRLRFGDPVFLGVVDGIDVTVEWSVPRGDVVVSGGRLAVTTLLRSESGWTRVLERVPEVDVDGLRASSTVRIDFPDALAFARSVDEAAGVSRPVRLEVLVETLLDDAVAPTGGAGTPVDGYSSATLAFALDDRVIRLVDIPLAPPRRDADPLAGLIPGTGAASTETGDTSTDSGGASSETGGASTETGSTSRFSQSAPGEDATDGRVGVREVVQMFATDVLEPNHLRLGPLRLEVETARRNLTLLGLLLLASGLLGLSVLRRIEEYGEAAVIEARYGPMLSPLPVGVNGHGAGAIDVGSFSALHALALDRDTPIMVDRAHRPDEVAHYLFDGPTTYRYVARGRPVIPGPVLFRDDVPLDEDAVDVGGPSPAS